MIMQLKFSAP
uniref:Uncharacterized protein n=1 Tax=Arundo donax TaxID=35708 RepID=A0A0A9CBD1_ARUDO